MFVGIFFVFFYKRYEKALTLCFTTFIKPNLKIYENLMFLIHEQKQTPGLLSSKDSSFTHAAFM